MQKLLDRLASEDRDILRAACDEALRRLPETPELRGALRDALGRESLHGRFAAAWVLFHGESRPGLGLLPPLLASLELDSLSLSTVYQLGQLYQSVGEADLATPYLVRARQMLERQVQDDPDDAGGQAMLALVLTRLGDAEGGEAVLQQALEVDPVSPEVLFDLARVAMAQGSSSAALAYLERAVEAGYMDFLRMKTHPDLEPLRTDPAFTSLVRSMIN